MPVSQAVALVIGLAFATPASASNIGEQGRTPGYWKHHTSNWEEYTPTRTLNQDLVFPASRAAIGGSSYLDGLEFGGGAGTVGAAKILMRATVAAFLNAAHEGLATRTAASRSRGACRPR